MTASSFFKSTTLFSLVLALAAGCGGDSSNSAAGPGSGGGGTGLPVPGPTPSSVSKALDVKPNEVSDEEGCMNLQKLYDRMGEFPETAIVRQVTTDFRVAPGRGASGNRPTDKIVKLLSSASYDLSEQSLADYLNALPKVTQDDCQTVAMSDGVEGDLKMKVTGWSENELTLESSTEQRVLTLKGDRELAIVTKYKALNFCEAGDTYDVQKTINVRWGERAELDQANETFHRAFLVKLSDSFAGFPADLSSLLEQTREESFVKLSIPQMQAIAALEIKPELKRCEGQPTEPEPPAPTPNSTPYPRPTAAPTAAPTAVPTAAPTAVPTAAPTAVPEPTPAPTPEDDDSWWPWPL